MSILLLYLETYLPKVPRVASSIEKYLELCTIKISSLKQNSWISGLRGHNPVIK